MFLCLQQVCCCKWQSFLLNSVLAGGEGEITWQKDGDEITDSDIFSKVDESSSRLSIKTAAFEDAGRYTCLCEFDSGHSSSAQTQVYVYGMWQLTVHTYFEVSYWAEPVVILMMMPLCCFIMCRIIFNFFFFCQRVHHLATPPHTMSFWRAQMA